MGGSNSIAHAKSKRNGSKLSLGSSSAAAKQAAGSNMSLAGSQMERPSDDTIEEEFGAFLVHIYIYIRSRGSFNHLIFPHPLPSPSPSPRLSQLAQAELSLPEAKAGTMRSLNIESEFHFDHVRLDNCVHHKENGNYYINTNRIRSSRCHSVQRELR